MDKNLNNTDIAPSPTDISEQEPQIKEEEEKEKELPRVAQTIKFEALSVSSTFEAMTRLKADTCKITSLALAEGEDSCSIYKYFETSNTFYEELALYNLCNIANPPKTLRGLQRDYVVEKYYVIDTLFPLFRGLYCVRKSFSGSTSSKWVNQHELSLYKETLKLIYFLAGYSSKYSEETVKSKYTPFELNILIPELVTGLVRGLISPKEKEILFELLRRDKYISIFLEKLADICKYTNAAEITPILPDFSPIIVWNPTVLSLLREYLSMGFATLFIQVFAKAKKMSSEINIRSISDFRMIFELETKYSVLDLTLDISNTSLGSITFRFISEVSTEIVGKYFL